MPSRECFGGIGRLSQSLLVAKLPKYHVSSDSRVTLLWVMGKHEAKSCPRCPTSVLTTYHIISECLPQSRLPTLVLTRLLLFSPCSKFNHSTTTTTIPLHQVKEKRISAVAGLLIVEMGSERADTSTAYRINKLNCESLSHDHVWEAKTSPRQSSGPNHFKATGSNS